MRAVLRRILCMRSFEVSEADNGRQACEVLHFAGAADLVLVSWIPQDTGTLELIARLRRKTAQKAIVILLATAEPHRRDLERAIRAGANDYLTKPFTSMQIDQKLERFGLAGQWHADGDNPSSCCR